MATRPDHLNGLMGGARRHDFQPPAGAGVAARPTLTVRGAYR